MKQDDSIQNSKFQKFGLLLAAAFFVLSVIMVIRNHGGMSVVFSPDTKVITFAHWQLEDGFREGFDAAIKIYEKEKAEQGVKVKVRQVAVPVRGYAQWYLTQLIGGTPADVLEITGSSDILNQYFTPLSPFIGEPNPWNKGTPLEKMAWRETFADDMLSALDTAYSEFFSVCIFMITTRVYINADLYEQATGSTALPKNVTEWLAACEKLKEYGTKTGRPIIPIGVRGFDKATLDQLFNNYNSQMNSDFSDFASPYGFGMRTATVFQMINDGELDRGRILKPVELLTEIGQYFADGFPAIDLEQTKYLFFSGNVGFFIDGSYNAYSMVNNSPFRVKIMRIPELDQGHRLGKGSFGQVTELGTGIGGRIGIPKRTKNFDLALDFLRFITSYRINQMTMVEYCRWLSSLKEVDYDETMKDLEPITGTSRVAISAPFNTGTYGRRKHLQLLESVIIANPDDPAQAYWEGFLAERPMIIDELREALVGIRRSIWNMDGTRAALNAGLISGAKGKARELLEMRSNINLEGIVSRYEAGDDNIDLTNELQRLKVRDE